MNAIQEAIASLRFGTPQTHRNLTVVPLIVDRPHEPGYRLLDEALEQHVARVTETSEFGTVPELPHSEVTVRVYEREVEILDAAGTLLRRHPKSMRKGHFEIAASDRLFNPSRETTRLLARVSKIGPHTAAFAKAIFARMGRPGQRAIYGLANLPRTYRCADIEAVCERLHAAQCLSYAAVRRALERHSAEAPAPALTQSGADIRALTEYQTFWETHSQAAPKGDTDGNVNHRT